MENISDLIDLLGQLEMHDTITLQKRINAHNMLKSHYDVIIPWLLEMLEDDSEDKRRLGVLGLGLLSSDNFTPQIIAALCDSSHTIRKTAQWAVKQMKDERSIEPMKMALDNVDVDGKRAIVSALASINITTVIPALLAVLEDPDDEVRRIAVQGLGQFRRDDVFPLIVSKLNDNNIRVRQQAVAAIGNFAKSEEAVATLIQCLTDNQPLVAFSAVGALSNIVQFVIDALVAQFESTENSNLVKTMAKILESSNLLLPWLVKVSHSPSLPVVYAAIDALGKSGNATGVKQLINLYERVEFQSAIVDALGSIYCHEAYQFLRTKFNLIEEDNDQFSHFLEAIRKHGHLADIPLLAGYIQFMNHDTYRAFETSVVELGEEAFPILESLLLSTNVTARGFVADVLKYFTHQQAVKILQMALNDDNPSVQETAIASLRLLNSKNTK
jgi:HEAT repeat protein